MKHLGNIDLLFNRLLNASLQPVSEWPTAPSVGTFINYENRIYLCVSLSGTGGLPVWLPVTSTVSTYLHTQSIAATEWLVSHGLGYSAPMVQVFDASGVVIQPGEVSAIDANTVVLSFSAPVAGKAIVICATDNQFNGGAANGQGSGTQLKNLDVLQQFTVADNVLKFGTNTVQFLLDNESVVLALSDDGKGTLEYEGKRIQFEFDNADVLAKLADDGKGALTYGGKSLLPPQRIAFYLDGQITTAASGSTIIMDTLTLKAGMSGSRAQISSFPSASVSLPVKINGTQIGQLSITATGSCTFASASDIQVKAGDVLTVVFDPLIGTGGGNLSIVIEFSP